MVPPTKFDIETQRDLPTGQAISPTEVETQLVPTSGKKDKGGILQEPLPKLQQ